MYLLHKYTLSHTHTRSHKYDYIFAILLLKSTNNFNIVAHMTSLLNIWAIKIHYKQQEHTMKK